MHRRTCRKDMLPAMAAVVFLISGGVTPSSAQNYQRGGNATTTPAYVPPRVEQEAQRRAELEEAQRRAELEKRKQALQQELARKQKELAAAQQRQAQQQEIQRRAQQEAQRRTQMEQQRRQAEAAARQRAAQHKQGFVPTDKGKPTAAATGSAPATVDGRASFQGPGIQRSGNAVITKPVPLSPSTAQNAQRRQAEAAARQRAEQQRMGGPMTTDKRLSTGGFSTVTAGSTPAIIGQSAFQAPTMQKVVRGSEKLLGGAEKVSESKAVQAVSSGARLAEDIGNPKNWDKVGQDIRETKSKATDAMTDAITGGFDPAKSNARFKSCMNLTGAAKTDCLKAEVQRSQQESARIEQGLKATNFMDNPTMQKVVRGSEKLLGGAEKVSESKAVQAVSSGARLAEDIKDIKKGSLSSLDKVGQDAREAKNKTKDAVVGGVDAAANAMVRAMGPDPTNSWFYKATNFMDTPTMQKVVQGNEKAWKGVDKIADKTVEGTEKVSESKTIQAISSGARLAKDMRSLSSLDKVGQDIRETKSKATDALGR